jgi:two-component system, NtrC family, response regulator PilR
MANLLIVDDEQSICEMLEIAFRSQGHRVESATNVDAALRKLERLPYDLLISDIKMPKATGLDLLTKVRETNTEMPVILITAHGTTNNALYAGQLGAAAYVEKSHEFVDDLKFAVDRALETRRIKEENEMLRRELMKDRGLDSIVGQSPPMKALFELILSIAPTNSTVLILGESGTGKELVARAIHDHSRRADKPFVSINCSAFQETLLESELFGYMKGAFTGAAANKKGLFEYASGGTLFMDEIGEMSLPMQVKLLRVLQERKIRPVGGNEEIEVDVRLIAATNRDLQQMVREERFRTDLFYRISVIPVQVPPLRSRPSDIPLLAFHFLERFAKDIGKDIKGVSAESAKLMESYSWPGNVRELENAIERAVALERGNEITVDALPERIVQGAAVSGADRFAIDLPGDGIDLQAHVEQIERRMIEAAIAHAGGVRTKAADLLKMSYRSFRHYAKKYDL